MVCISWVGKYPVWGAETPQKNDILSVDKLSGRYFVCRHFVCSTLCPSTFCLSTISLTTAYNSPLRMYTIPKHSLKWIPKFIRCIPDMFTAKSHIKVLIIYEQFQSNRQNGWCIDKTKFRWIQYVYIIIYIYLYVYQILLERKLMKTSVGTCVPTDVTQSNLNK